MFGVFFKLIIIYILCDSVEKEKEVNIVLI